MIFKLYLHCRQGEAGNPKWYNWFRRFMYAIFPTDKHSDFIQEIVIKIFPQ